MAIMPTRPWLKGWLKSNTINNTMYGNMYENPLFSEDNWIMPSIPVITETTMIIGNSNLNNG